jgi:hypothetical protein
MSFLENFQMCKSQKGQFMRNDLGTRKSWKCVQGWQAPHEAIQKLRFDVLNYVCNVLGIIIMHYNAHGHFWETCFGALRLARQTDSAC